MFANKLHEKGHELMLSGENEAAIALYTDALIETPNDPDIYSDRGVAYLHLKNRVECMSDLNYALQLQPEYSFRYSARAYAKDFFGETEEAIMDYEIAIQLDPEDAVAYNNLGLLQEKLGYQLKAKENFEKADTLDQQEKKLFDLIDEMEKEELNQKTPTYTADRDKPISDSSHVSIDSNDSLNTEKHEMINPQIIRERNISTFQEFKRIFTSKLQLKEFFRFLKNGFRIKKR